MYDASPIRLPAGLSSIFPGNRKNHSPACLKLSALYRLSVRSIEWIKISAQKPHDSKFLPDLNQLKGSLFLFDLGYFSHTFLHQLCEIGVWFVCRLKANSVPIITKVVKGVAKRHIGRPLDKNVNLRGIIVEVWGKLNLPGNKSLEVRFIGFRFPLTKQYRWYVTNMPNSMVLAEWIYPIYRLRWQIELFFKWIKQNLKVKTFLGTSKNAVLTQLWIALCVYLFLSFLKFKAKLGLSLTTILRLLQLNLFQRRTLIDLLKPPDRTEPAVSPQLLLWNQL